MVIIWRAALASAQIKNGSGDPVLIVYTAQAEVGVAEHLPDALSHLPIKFVHTGEIKAQDN